MRTYSRRDMSASSSLATPKGFSDSWPSTARYSSTAEAYGRKKAATSRAANTMVSTVAMVPS